MPLFSAKTEIQNPCWREVQSVELSVLGERRLSIVLAFPQNHSQTRAGRLAVQFESWSRNAHQLRIAGGLNPCCFLLALVKGPRQDKVPVRLGERNDFFNFVISPRTRFPDLRHCPSPRPCLEPNLRTRRAGSLDWAMACRPGQARFWFFQDRSSDRHACFATLWRFKPMPARAWRAWTGGNQASVLTEGPPVAHVVRRDRPCRILLHISMAAASGILGRLASEW